METTACHNSVYCAKNKRNNSLIFVTAQIQKQKSHAMRYHLIKHR